MTEPTIGSYGLVRTKTISAWFIQLGTKSFFDHAFIYLGDGRIAEATPRKGIHIGDVHSYSNIAWNMHEPVTQVEGIAIANAAESFVGQKYLFRAILAIAFKILHLPLPVRLLGDLDKAHGAICSEFVVKARRKAGVPIEGKKFDYLVSPADLANRLLYI